MKKWHIIYLVLLVILGGSLYAQHQKTEKLQQEITILKEIDPIVEYVEVCTFNDLTPQHNLYRILVTLKMPHPEIVLQQAILETGHFNPRYIAKYHNLFGIMDGKGRLVHYNHWIESVIAYKRYFSNKYKGGDYYKFLEDCHYAEAGYVTLLKQIDVKPYIHD